MSSYQAWWCLKVLFYFFCELHFSFHPFLIRSFLFLFFISQSCILNCTLVIWAYYCNLCLQEHIDYDVQKSSDPLLKKATVQINIFKQHRQTIQVEWYGKFGFIVISVCAYCVGENNSYNYWHMQKIVFSGYTIGVNFLSVPTIVIKVFA